MIQDTPTPLSQTYISYEQMNPPDLPAHHPRHSLYARCLEITQISSPIEIILLALMVYWSKTAVIWVTIGISLATSLRRLVGFRTTVAVVVLSLWGIGTVYTSSPVTLALWSSRFALGW